MEGEVGKQATRLLGIVRVAPLLRARTMRKAQHPSDSQWNAITHPLSADEPAEVGDTGDGAASATNETLVRTDRETLTQDILELQRSDDFCRDASWTRIPEGRVTRMP